MSIDHAIDFSRVFDCFHEADGGNVIDQTVLRHQAGQRHTGVLRNPDFV